MSVVVKVLEGLMDAKDDLAGVQFFIFPTTTKIGERGCRCCYGSSNTLFFIRTKVKR